MTTSTESPKARDPLTDAWQATQYAAHRLTQLRMDRGDQLPAAAADAEPLRAAATEVLRLIETGPRAVRCVTCKAAAGISCTGPRLAYGQCHTERRHDAQGAAQATLRRALGLPVHNPPARCAVPADEPTTGEQP